jgi:hypothetical protein
MARTQGSDSDLTADQELILDALDDGSYFVDNEIPVGDLDDLNVTFVLSNIPNPAASLKLTLNGQLLKADGDDYTLAGNTITMSYAPSAGNLLASYRVDPT